MLSSPHHDRATILARKLSRALKYGEAKGRDVSALLADITTLMIQQKTMQIQRVPAARAASRLDRLPSTVLELIVARLNQLEVPEHRFYRPSQQMTCLQTLAATSPHLRKQLMSMPQVWTNALIAHHGSDRVGWMRLCLERSNPLPACVVISNFGTRFDEILELITEHLPRLSYLDVPECDGAQWSRLSSAMMKPAPALERFCILQDNESCNLAFLPPEIFAGDARQLRRVGLADVRIAVRPTEYPAFYHVTHLQYQFNDELKFGVIPDILAAFPSLQHLGLEVDEWSGFDHAQPTPPLEPPRSLQRVIVSYTLGSSLQFILNWLAKIPTVESRPRDWYQSGGSYPILPLGSWTALEEMHCQWRRGVATFRAPESTLPIPDHDAGASAQSRHTLRLYARRGDILRMLRLVPSSAALTRFTLDEAHWEYLATDVNITPTQPLRLAGLVDFQIMLASCSQYYHASVGPGIWTSTEFFRSLDLPSLDVIHLAHQSARSRQIPCEGPRLWNPPRIRGRPCLCKNAGIVAMEQVLDLLKQHTLPRSSVVVDLPSNQRLPSLVLSGITEVLDDTFSEQQLQNYVRAVTIFTPFEIPTTILDDAAVLDQFTGKVISHLFR